MKIKNILFVTLLLVVSASACIPPKCKIPNCHVVIDHNHLKYGKEVKGGQSPYKVYRGVPFFAYIFRKKYRAESADGYYRKIDTREAYHKSIKKKK
jgi:hypothetical protein